MSDIKFKSNIILLSIIYILTTCSSNDKGGQPSSNPSDETEKSKNTEGKLRFSNNRL